jgi:hypothetical protein
MPRIFQSPCATIRRRDSADAIAVTCCLCRYESEMHLVDEEMKMSFVPCAFQLDTTQVSPRSRAGGALLATE